MNFVLGVAIMIFAVYATAIAIGALMGSVTGETWDGVKLGAILATIISGTFGLLLTGAMVMIR